MKSILCLHGILAVVLAGLQTGRCVADEPARGAPAKEEPPRVFSGPQKGEKLLPLKVTGVYDQEAGKELDYVAEAKGKPLLLVFVHKLTRPSIGLTRLLTSYCRENFGDRIQARVVWLDKDSSSAREYLTRARSSINLKVPVGISPDGEEGPGSYGLNRQVTLTILTAKDDRVESNFALIQPGETDAPAILAEAAKLAGATPPTPEELKKYSVYGGRERMEKKDGRPGAERDPRLGELLRRVIQKDAKPEEVDEAVRAVEEHIKEKPDLQRQLGDITKSVVGSKGFAEGGYGTEKAREQIRQWARKYAPQGS